MSDNTALPTATGGDVIRTEVVSEDYAGNQVKVQLVKLLTGRGRLSPPGAEGTIGADEGVATSLNPLPVMDDKCKRLLEEILVIEYETLDLMHELADAMRPQGAAARPPIVGR